MRFYTHPGMSPIYTFCKLSASDWPQKNQRRMANHPTPMMFRIARTSLLLGDPERIGDGGTEAFQLPDFRLSYRPTSSMSKAVSERMPTFAVDGINVAPAAFSGWREAGMIGFLSPSCWQPVSHLLFHLDIGATSLLQALAPALLSYLLRTCLNLHHHELEVSCRCRPFDGVCRHWNGRHSCRFGPTSYCRHIVE